MPPRAALNPAFVRQDVLDLRINNRRAHEPGQPEKGFHQQHGNQQLPRCSFDFVADDVGVQEIFELVDAD